MNRWGWNPVAENRAEGVIRLSVLEFGNSFFSSNEIRELSVGSLSLSLALHLPGYAIVTSMTFKFDILGAKARRLWCNPVDLGMRVCAISG